MSNFREIISRVRSYAGVSHEEVIEHPDCECPGCRYRKGYLDAMDIVEREYNDFSPR